MPNKLILHAVEKIKAEKFSAFLIPADMPYIKI